MVRYVGCDVHKREVEVCILDAHGKLLERFRISCTREGLLRFATQRLQPTDRLVLEATTNTWEVVSLLQPHVAQVVISNPLQTRAIAQAKVKTDKVDAYVLAQLLRCDYLPSVWIPDERTRILRKWTHRRATLVADRTRLKNRLHSVLHQLLIPPPKTGLFSQKGLAFLMQLELPEPERSQVESDLRLLDQVERELETVDLQLAQIGYADARVKLLMTIPGVDYTVAQTLLAALGDISRFPDADHAASYLGLCPSTKQSGDHCYHGPITKRGHSRARWLLIQAAQHLDRHPGPLGVFFRRLMRKKNRNVAVVATARKLVAIAYHMLKNNEPYRYSQPRPTQDKLARLRVRATGQKRRTGPRKGTLCRRSPEGVPMRTIPSLPEVYAKEGLPPCRPLSQLPPGEQRLLRDTDTVHFAHSMQTPQRIPRKKVDAARR